MFRLLFVAVASLLVVSCQSYKVSVIEENDAFSYGPPTDANYTQGLQVLFEPETSYKPCEQETHDGACQQSRLIRKVINALNVFDNSRTDADIRIRYGVGQQIYTPNDISRSHIIEDDRPYAGYLFGRLQIDNNALSANSQGVGDRVRRVDVKLGMVGPASFADETQTWWHEVCACTQPMGWDNQIRNELGVEYTLTQMDRVAALTLGQGIAADFTTFADASIGNVYTGVGVGGQVRFGYNLPRSLRRSLGEPIRPAVLDSGRAIQSRGRADNFYLYSFIGAEGKLVARDIFLQGGLFSSSPHTVGIRHGVGELVFGVSMGIKRFEATVLYARRSRQFDEQTGDHKFGQLHLAWLF